MIMNQPNHPDEIWLGKKEYSIWTDWRVNGWLFVATIISAASDIMFPHWVRQCPVSLRAAIAAAPFLAILLWVRSLAQWIRGMDELHRRLMLSAILFATGATFFVVIFCHRLDAVGVFPSKLGASWDIATVGHSFLLMTCFYFLGYRVCSRRFR